eukprot:gb/GECG01013990.1/.p1 GENE.gb/GECG01013990.1/~~gb/GECG01013990.1/.p1  ORF type:complete len:329 (+),score=19.06 gb/GECG01013990.1/:1-987(+)
MRLLLWTRNSMWRHYPSGRMSSQAPLRVPQSCWPCTRQYVYTYAHAYLPALLHDRCVCVCVSCGAIIWMQDVVKTRAQLATTGTTSLVGTLTNIVKEEGIFALYRGLASPLMIEPMKRSVKFAANSKFKELFMGSHHEENTIRHFSAGACAGMTEILVISPFEVVKVRLQAKERKSVYKNSFDAFGKMLKAEGPLVFYTGFEAALIRQAMWNGPYFASIYKLKQILPHPNSKPEELLYKFLSGVAGGVIGTTCNTPLDVVTSRMRNVLPGEVTKYRYSLQSVTLILREEGIRSLYRGYVPKVVRLGPGGGIMIVMFEFAQKMLQTPST